MGSEGSPLYLWFRSLSLGLAAGLIALAFVESAVRALVFDRPVDKRTITVNLGMWLFELVLRTASGGVRWVVFSAASTLAPVSWPLNPLTWVGLYLLVDLFYYSRHRLLHTTRLGWALHAPHHASTDLSLTSALRLGWVQRVLDDFFYVPLVLLGAPPLAVFIAVELNHASQLWCHTEVIGRLPFLDRFLNTPQQSPGAPRVRSRLRRLELRRDLDVVGQAVRHLPPRAGPVAAGLGRAVRGHQPLRHPVPGLREWLRG